MNARLKNWKLASDRLWSNAAFDHREAAVFVLDVMRESPDPLLAQAAAQALPALRAACLDETTRRSKDIALRRFAVVRNALHALAGPQFGKRGGKALSPEELHRQTLGLPLGGKLFGPAISQAYKRAAKKAHPDGGGDQRAFLEVAAARNALMKSL